MRAAMRTHAALAAPDGTCRARVRVCLCVCGARRAGKWLHPMHPAYTFAQSGM